jgi:drug/metabolite transporter (DMT)-like permease
MKAVRVARPHGRIALRTPSSLELMLFGAIVMWALNLSMSRYILTHGVHPLAYVSVRYGVASAVFIAIGLLTEGTLRIAREHIWLVLVAALAIFLNQLAFTYAVKGTSASVIALILAAVPIFAAVIGLALRTEQLSRRFWIGAAVSFAGVGLVVLGTGGELRQDGRGVLLGIAAAATWAAYSVAITPLMRQYSPVRISAVVLSAMWLPSTLLAGPQLRSQDWDLGAHVWLLVVVATVGSLILTNFAWFHSLDRIGAARATLAANLQPFLAAIFAVGLLSESLSLVQVLGGVLIAGGILGARRRPPAVGPETPVVS